MKRDLLQAPNAERGESVVVFESAELTLDGSAAPVQATEPLRVSWDAREQATAESERQGWLIRLRAFERDNGFEPRVSHSS